MTIKGLPIEPLIFTNTSMENCVVCIHNIILLLAIQTDVGKFTVSILFQYSPSITDERPNSNIEYTVK